MKRKLDPKLQSAWRAALAAMAEVDAGKPGILPYSAKRAIVNAIGAENMRDALRSMQPTTTTKTRKSYTPAKMSAALDLIDFASRVLKLEETGLDRGEAYAEAWAQMVPSAVPLDRKSHERRFAKARKLSAELGYLPDFSFDERTQQLQPVSLGKLAPGKRRAKSKPKG